MANRSFNATIPSKLTPSSSKRSVARAPYFVPRNRHRLHPVYGCRTTRLASMPPSGGNSSDSISGRSLPSRFLPMVFSVVMGESFGDPHREVH